MGVGLRSDRYLSARFLSAVPSTVILSDATVLVTSLEDPTMRLPRLLCSRYWASEVVPALPRSGLERIVAPELGRKIGAVGLPEFADRGIELRFGRRSDLI